VRRQIQGDENQQIENVHGCDLRKWGAVKVALRV
jgi:hypothetical protein